jgi:hypothetical protein
MHQLKIIVFSHLKMKGILFQSFLIEMINYLHYLIHPLLHLIIPQVHLLKLHLKVCDLLNFH